MNLFHFLKGVSGNVEIQRLMALFSNMAGIIYAGFHLFVNRQFSIIEFGIGMGSLNALIGGGMLMKDTGVANAIAKAQPASETPQDVNVAEVGGKPVNA